MSDLVYHHARATLDYITQLERERGESRQEVEKLKSLLRESVEFIARRTEGGLEAMSNTGEQVKRVTGYCWEEEFEPMHVDTSEGKDPSCEVYTPEPVRIFKVCPECDAHLVVALKKAAEADLKVRVRCDHRGEWVWIREVWLLGAEEKSHE